MEQEKAALRLDPLHTISRVQLCRCYHYLGQPDQVATELENLREDDTARHLVFFTDGWVNWCRRDWILAAQLFEKGLETEPGNVYPIGYLSDCYYRLGQIELAESLLTRAIAQNPDNYDLLSRLGKFYLHAGLSRDSGAVFLRAWKSLRCESKSWLNHRSLIYHFNAGWMLAMEGHTQRALDMLEKAVFQGYGHDLDFKIRPDWDPLRDNPRFENLLQQIETTRTASV